MLAFDTVRNLRNEKKYEPATNANMSENSSSGNNPAMSTHQDDFNSESEARIPTQEDAKEQIKNYIAPLTLNQCGGD